MKKVGMSLEGLKIEDTRQEGGGGNERSHRDNLDSASRLPEKGAVRRGRHKIRTARKGPEGGESEMGQRDRGSVSIECFEHGGGSGN